MDGSEEKDVALVGKIKEKKKYMSKVNCFSCHNIGHYTSQCSNKKKKQEPKVSASTEIVDLTKKYENKFSLMTGPLGNGCLVFEDIEVWFVDNEASWNMT
jgi:hypothetical protein